MPSTLHSHSRRSISVEISPENVENVVKPPRKPVVTSSRASGDSKVWRVMISIANPINRPPNRFAASVPSGSVGNTGFRTMLRPQRTHAPTAAPPPTAMTPAHENTSTPFRVNCKGSAHEPIDVVGAEPTVGVMIAAHLDLREHVLVSVLPSFAVEIDHCAADVEKRDHLRAIGGNGQRMDFARRLIDEAALLRGPVVLEVFPASFDDVTDDQHRMAMT